MAFQDSLEVPCSGLVKVKKEEPDWPDFTVEQDMTTANALNVPGYVPVTNDLSQEDIKPILPCAPQLHQPYQEVKSFTLPVDIFQSMLSSVLCGRCNRRDVRVRREEMGSGKYSHGFVIFCGVCGDVLFC